MIISWTVKTFNLWDAMFHIGRIHYVQSDKEEKSDELIGVANSSTINFPTYTKPIVPRMVYKYCQLSFPEIDSCYRGRPSRPGSASADHRISNIRRRIRVLG